MSNHYALCVFIDFQLDPDGPFPQPPRSGDYLPVKDEFRLEALRQQPEFVALEKETQRLTCHRNFEPIIAEGWLWVGHGVDVAT